MDDITQATAAFLRQHGFDRAYSAAIILGTGLGGLADELTDTVSLPYADIPHFPLSRVSGHAELWRRDRMMVAALRYRDVYVRTPAGWRFGERVIGFLYYVDAADYPGILGHRDRNRAYDAPLPADFPEALPGWARQAEGASHG